VSSVNAALLGTLLVLVSLAAISALAMIASAREGDAASAWMWAAIFVGTSLLAAWLFWRIV
jgi:hydrogenase/urease accessory protein HupE